MNKERPMALNIPNVCRRARIIRGETQVLSAIRYGVDPGTVSRWENGKARPPPKVFHELYEIVIVHNHIKRLIV